jgi:UDP-glucoronosyl and UDP-glucosyl transferase
LPKVDVLVNNGGYGSVNQALSFGIPLVTAGLTEDKADVNLRVAWSGVGINLATNAPSCEALRRAVRTVLDSRATAYAPRKWRKSSPGSTPDPKSSGSSADLSRTRKHRGGPARWRPAADDASLASDDLTATDSEGGLRSMTMTQSCGRFGSTQV